MAVDADCLSVEGDCPYKRFVLVSFPSAEKAKEFYDGKEYQENVLPIRFKYQDPDGFAKLVKAFGA